MYISMCSHFYYQKLVLLRIGRAPYFFCFFSFRGSHAFSSSFLALSQALMAWRFTWPSTKCRQDPINLSCQCTHVCMKNPAEVPQQTKNIHKHRLIEGALQKTFPDLSSTDPWDGHWVHSVARATGSRRSDPTWDTFGGAV